ncbi:MAG TPA: M23 family metallopeptidase [bacterium]|nr:M23 family metallopeptidase [bacterium]
MKRRIRKWLGRRLTILLIPHDKSRPIRTSLSLNFIYSVLILWIFSSACSVFIISQEINYRETVRANKELREKAEYFAKSLAEERDLICQLKEMDTRLRGLLHMKNPEDIVELGGIGGPSAEDAYSLTLVMQSGNGLSKELFQMNLNALERETWERKQSFHEINDYLAYQRSLLLATPSIWPTFGRVTSSYGWRRHPLTQRREFHYAIDIANLKGTPVRATADGRVIVAGWQGTYGRSVMIDHGQGFSTRYAHNSTVLVKPGERVKRGQIVALSGDTGSVTASHVHYEVWYQGKPVNPLLYVKSKPFFTKR